MTLDEAYGLITTDPRKLLDSAFLAIAGGGESSKSGGAIFAISKPNLLQDKYKRLGSNDYIPCFEVKLLQGQQIAKPTLIEGTVEWRTFPAYYVAMKKMEAEASNKAPTGTYFSLPPQGQLDICVTSQLSGCTFAIGSQTLDSSCLVCHIQPSGSNLQGARTAMVQQAGKLFGQAPDLIVQRGTQYSALANVIGQRKQGKWSFFIQKFSLATDVIEPVADVR